MPAIGQISNSNSQQPGDCHLSFVIGPGWPAPWGGGGGGGGSGCSGCSGCWRRISHPIHPDSPATERAKMATGPLVNVGLNRASVGFPVITWIYDRY